jgi:hypothetical protein
LSGAARNLDRAQSDLRPFEQVAVLALRFASRLTADMFC